MGALTTAHENHLLCIQDRESQMMTRTNAWKNRLIKKVWVWRYWRLLAKANAHVLSFNYLQLKEEELQRNRVVLSDFATFLHHYEEEIHKLLNRWGQDALGKVTMTYTSLTFCRECSWQQWTVLYRGHFWEQLHVIFSTKTCNTSIHECSSLLIIQWSCFWIEHDALLHDTLQTTCLRRVQGHPQMCRVMVVTQHLQLPSW